MVNKVFELKDLNGVNGVIMNGIAAYDQSGYSVASAGDVNGDGIDDVIIGAYVADPNGKNDAGQSYLVFGQSSWTSPLELSSLDGANGVIMNGIAAGDYSGREVSAAGDVNGDGIDDVIIGAHQADPNGIPVAGQSYLVFGQSTWTSPLELSSLDGTNGVIMNGMAQGDHSGGAVSAAGDVNGDGIGDVIIGAYGADLNGKSSAGQSYLVFGQSTWTSPLTLSSLDGTNGVIMNGIAVEDYSGTSVSSAGDVNGDGLDDLVIGAFGADPNGKESAGQSYLVFGQSFWTSPLALSRLDGANGVIMNGIAAGDYSGHSVSTAGDVNGDGIDDVIIGAFGAGPNGQGGMAGQSYLVFGQSTWRSPLALSSLDGTNGVIIHGIAGGDRSGVAVAAAGDVNGDGIDDVIIGAHQADPNGKGDAGQSYLVFGQSTWTSPFELSSLDGDNGVIMNGIAVSDYSGREVSAAGDVNGDGIDDVIISAPVADPNGKSAAGQSYLLFGGPEQFSDNQLSICPNETLPLNTRDLAVEPIIGHRIFTVSEVEQGQFEFKSNPGIAITQFTQQQIMEGDVLFVHNGSNIAPSYVVEANSITRIFSDVKPQSANVSFIIEPSTSIQPVTIPTTTATTSSTTISSTTNSLNASSVNTSTSSTTQNLGSVSTTTPTTTASTSSTSVPSTRNSSNASSANTSTSSTTQNLDSVGTTTPTIAKTTAIRDSTSPSDSPEIEHQNNAPKNNSTIPIAVGAAVGVAALATAGLFAWRRHQRKQNATLPSSADVRLETVEMAHNPLHPSTGRRVWDADTYAIRENEPAPNDERWNPTLYGAGGKNSQIHRRVWDPDHYAINGEDRSQTREWDAGTYAVREYKPAPNDKRWNPTLYGARGNNAQIHRHEWDPVLYETGAIASDNVTYTVPFEANQDSQITKAARTATVRK